jgi:hypothetical protein
MEAISEILKKDPFSPENLLEFLKQDPVLAAQYKGGIGLQFSCSLEEHTILVLKQFEKYFKDVELPGKTGHHLFRLILALHDIGKPEAVREGDKRLQHKFTKNMLVNLKGYLPLSGEEWDLTMSLLERDPIGYFLRGYITLEESMVQIKVLAKKSHKSLRDFFDLMTIYYQVDAGGYTSDAGWKPLLDKLFVRDEKVSRLTFDSQKGRLKFSEETNENFMLLEQRLFT